MDTHNYIYMYLYNLESYASVIHKAPSYCSRVWLRFDTIHGTIKTLNARVCQVERDPKSARCDDTLELAGLRNRFVTFWRCLYLNDSKRPDGAETPSWKMIWKAHDMKFSATCTYQSRERVVWWPGWLNKQHVEIRWSSGYLWMKDWCANQSWSLQTRDSHLALWHRFGIVNWQTMWPSPILRLYCLYYSFLQQSWFSDV